MEETAINQIINFGIDVFADPTVHTCIVVVERGGGKAGRVNVRKQVQQPEELTADFDYQIDQTELGANATYSFDVFVDPIAAKILTKIKAQSKDLGEVLFVRQCIKTGNDDEYVKATDSNPGGTWKPSLRGRSIGRYQTTETNLWLNYGDWLARNWKNRAFYETRKIAIRETGDRINATLDFENRFFLSSLYSVYPINANENRSLNFFLAIINSNLAMYVLNVVALNLTAGAFTKFRTNQLARLPIRTIDFSNPDEKAMHDRIVELVEKMIEAKKNLAAARTDAERNSLERLCDHIDRQIDDLVYKLYDITPEERVTIEEATG